MKIRSELYRAPLGVLVASCLGLAVGFPGWREALSAQGYNGYGYCEVPEGDNPSYLAIPPLSCAPDVTMQTPLLDREDEDGNRVEIFCESGEFHLYYVATGGSGLLVGRCPWIRGDNLIEIEYVGTDDQHINCFRRSEWSSQEGQAKISFLTNECILSTYTFPAEYCPGPQQLLYVADKNKSVPIPDSYGVVDWTEYVFYPAVSDLTLSYFVSDLGRAAPGTATLEKEEVNVDPLVFDPPADGEPIPIDPSGPPMTLRQLIRCDINLDRKCDNKDSELFEQALGTCIGDYYYIRTADADGDGCVTQDDKEKLRAYDPDKDGVRGFEDACPLSVQSATVVIGECDSGVTNVLGIDGCTMVDEVDLCAEGARNHGGFVSCAALLTNALMNEGTISGDEKDAIQSCAASAKSP